MIIHVIIFMLSGDKAHQRRLDPAHHLQRVPAHGSRQGGDARPRPRTPQGDPLSQYQDRILLTRYFRTVTLMGTTRTPTPAQPLASPAPPSGEKIFSLLCRRGGGCSWGRQLNWPASQSVAFYGREIFSWPRNIANFAKITITP